MYLKIVLYLKIHVIRIFLNIIHTENMNDLRLCLLIHFTGLLQMACHSRPKMESLLNLLVLIARANKQPMQV